METSKETMKLNDACNACNGVDQPLNDEGYCAPCMKEERSGPWVACDIMVRDRKGGGYHKCSKRGKFYNEDDGFVRCTSHQAKHDRITAGYIKDMKEAGYMK
jgi:hypothetical protein